MMIEGDYTFAWDGSSGVIGSPINLQCSALHLAAYVQASTIASTASFNLQTAPSSGGPWATEGSTSISASASATSQDVLRLTGALAWVRCYTPTKSTGTHFLRYIAVG